MYVCIYIYIYIIYMYMYIYVNMYICIYMHTHTHTHTHTGGGSVSEGGALAEGISGLHEPAATPAELGAERDTPPHMLHEPTWAADLLKKRSRMAVRLLVDAALSYWCMRP
jgi:hypothetical protein